MPVLKGVVQRMLGVQIGGVHTLALAGLALGEFLIDGGASLIGLGFAAGDLSIGAFFGICQNSLLFLLGLLDDLAALRSVSMMRSPNFSMISLPQCCILYK